VPYDVDELLEVYRLGDMGVGVHVLTCSGSKAGALGSIW
jgi:hypothetical protein